MSTTSIYLDTFNVIPYVERNNQALKIEASSDNDTLESLANKVANCQKCELHKNRTQTVFGVGSKSPELLIIGEAPGFYEDKAGEPFVGRAGSLLNLMLKSVDIKREDVYIANVLKCRPDNNRDPKPSEVESCTPYLLAQAKLLKPKLILALGRHAAHFLLKNTDPLTKLRQKKHTFFDLEIPLIVTYHPAYLLRNPKDKKHSYHDLLEVKKILKNLQGDRK